VAGELADRIRELLEARGRLSAKVIASLLDADATRPPIRKQDVNSALYRLPEWFRRVDGPFWRPPEWELTEGAAGVTSDLPKRPTPPIAGQIELIEAAGPLETVFTDALPSADQLALEEERRRRQASLGGSSTPNNLRSVKAVHIDSPTHPLSEDFHRWSAKEKGKYIDQEPG
jgi:hypothetical protein